MFHLKAFFTFVRSTKILLMVLLLGFELVLSFPGRDVSSINQAAFQQTRSQLLVNSIYALVYRPASEQRQALRDLQSVLPVFEQEQMFLLTDTTAEVQTLLQQAQADYLPLVASVQTIIAHPHNGVNPIELTIIALHERNYLVTMSPLVSILSQHIEDHTIQLFVIQIIIEIFFIVLFVIAMTTFVWETRIGKSAKTTPEPSYTAFFVRRLLVFVLMIVLMGVEIVPLGAGNDAVYFKQATLQRTLCEVFVQSTFVLAYRPVAERTQALSDVQFVLPLFGQEQAILSSNKNAEVNRHVQAAQSEYQIMSGAAQALTTNPGKAVDPVLVNTIVSHAHSCVSQMDGIVLALQNQMEQQTTLIFFTEVTIEGAFIIFFTALLLFSRNPFVRLEQQKGKALVI